MNIDSAAVVRYCTWQHRWMVGMAALEFGIFDTLAEAESATSSWSDSIERHLRDAQLAEQLGYKYFFFIEHQNARFPVISAPTVYLAALARATRSIRIGAMIFQVPLHHPIRLAQDTALIDQLSQGRLEFAIGYGTRSGEFNPWLVNYAERREMGVEAVEIMLKAWTLPEVTHQGRYWSFERAVPQPHPYQKPHPRVWMGGHSPESFDYAARNNFAVAQNMDVEDRIVEKFDYYRDAWKRCGHPGPMPATLLVRNVHVARTDREAREEAEQYMLEGLIGRQGVERAMSLKKEEATPAMLEISRVYIETSKSYDFWIDEGLAFVGSPETVIRQIEAQQKRAGYDILLAHHQFSKMPHELTVKSMKLFGEAVIPAFAPPRAAAIAGE
jgi:alkanesulfonate monooxygenase SsuD/methylene tetrahydromethanopterin reductase-like flavin-dependent oxidoreductase (luciferase family)